MPSLTVVLAVITYFYTGNLVQTSGITIIFSVAATIIDYVHERIWTRITYSANPQRINMSDNGGNTNHIQTNKTYCSRIKLILEKESIDKISLNEYSVMIKSSASEGIEQNQERQQEVQHPLFVSLLFPIPVLLDLPQSAIPDQQQVVSDKNLIPNNDDEDNQSPRESFFGIRDISLLLLIRVISLSGAIALVGYLIYIRVRRSRKSDNER